jgi:hypothetical protein
MEPTIADGGILIRSGNNLYEQERWTREYAGQRITVHAQMICTGGRSTDGGALCCRAELPAAGVMWAGHD